MNINGIIVGITVFIIIGVLHPIVIYAEYYFGKKIWPLFFLLGNICILISLFIKNNTFSCLLCVLGFSLFWSIRELFEQEKRVKKGWYPKNPKRKF